MDLSAFPLKHLEPRQCFLSRKPTLVSTVLGSCVAITMFDSRTRIGGMAHAFLPDSRNYPDDAGYPCKFVDTSIRHMLCVLRRLRVELPRLEVKLFGGGNSWNAEQTSARDAPSFGSWASVGPRNVDAARAVITEHGLRIAAEEVGGSLGRKVLFLTHTGGVWVKKLRGRNGA
ncbi:chemotaxis protein CheD [Oceanidesulfovibrio indonesiensis]|uniref:Probable chemoreceptor glutamine deamidase CheD n=1 Tax=Oceanidesulfovibrio indonesiensis TaxID=54767 RepID=A0A7M3MIC5_9BACT|nr:chemotaxis protein CheD [Oceanidesulfovibrio indonesiensis]TVM19369.1 chemotaxis protein CheD [Oceanidesulfovibrio indonesiensis]